MELIANATGIVTLGVTSVLYLLFARKCPSGPLSLPCVTLLTGMFYYYVIPAILLNGGDTGYLGVNIDSLVLVHVAAFLYVLGVSAACFVGQRTLMVNPATPLMEERQLNRGGFWIVTGIAGVGIGTLVVTGQLNLTVAADFSGSTELQNVAFLQLSVSMLLPVTIVYVIRQNFGPRAMVAVAAVTFVFLVTGFRFRLAILAIAIAASYCLTRGIKMGAVSIAISAIVGQFAMNLVGLVRTYGAGLKLNHLEGLSWSEILHAIGGEVGPLFALFSVIEHPPSELIGTDPWTIAIARLVPSFLWPDKPYPQYLTFYTLAFDEATRFSAGIAGPQQAEILLQYSWPGLVVLPFSYFLFIIYLHRRLNRLSYEVRVAGAALLPGVFGFYMQQRGYFFQNLCEGLFIIGPLFLMSAGGKVKAPSLEATDSPSR